MGVSVSLLVIGRLALWPIRRIARRDSTQPAENAVCSASLAKASSDDAEPHRLSAPPALTVSNTKNSCMMRTHTIKDRAYKCKDLILQKHTEANVYSNTDERAVWVARLDTETHKHTSSRVYNCYTLTSGSDLVFQRTLKTLNRCHGDILLCYVKLCLWRRNKVQTAFLIIFGLYESKRACGIVNHSNVPAKFE